ncbi:two-component system response regulator [Desulfobulbus rhabdoformis]|uniref:response regulator n=1 Tax=Desulfobulbus rhabdoformis TaxID=34032 RepID=UPI001965ACA9|nr:two-component system response regulator [Desulfobulbus rhabdoformis]MBM9614548.1 two-component system response regulator [Desulfobulbus rhabdoformis]
MVQDTQSTVLIVDDVETNIDIMVETLGEEYDLSVAIDGSAALELAMETSPDLILLDIMMPGMDGYETCRQLKASEKTKDIPVIFLTAMTEKQDEARGLSLGAVDYITKPFSPELVKARVRNQLELKRHRDNLEALVQERTRELQLTQEVTIESMATIAEYRDPETGGHIQRTKRYVKALAEQLKEHPKFEAEFCDTTIHMLYLSAPLHDIGKVGVPDMILLKPGKLTTEEFDEMKKHAIYGRDAIRAANTKLGIDSFLKIAEEIAYTHHEKWDGSGYPQGLKGQDIPLAGRLMAVADVYDALISKRVYKAPFPHSKAVSIIEEGRGNHFDPDVVDAFIHIADRFRELALEFADFEEEREALR